MKKNKYLDLLLNYGIVIILIFLIIVFSIASSNFLKVTTIFTILKQVSIVGVISIGMTYVMLTGGIDLSVGSVAGVSSVTAAMLMMRGVPISLACLITIAVAFCYGLFDGFLVTSCRMPAMIATLGVMTSLRGLAYIVTGGLPVFGFNANFGNFATGNLFGVIPYPVILMAVLYLIAYFGLEKTVHGRYIYGIGGNEEASRLSGVNVKQIKMFVYAISGVLAGVAGLVLLSRTNSGQPDAGTGYEMDSITAVCLGGVSLSGGVGKIGLVVVGVIIMGVLTTGMIMCNINDYVQQLVKGLVLIGAVIFSISSKRIRTSLADAK